MKRRIFRRIFVMYALVLLVSVIFIDIYITRVVKTYYIGNLAKHLSIQANLIAGSNSLDGKMNMDEVSRQLKEMTGARISIIASDGTVLGDSDTESSLMDNHADRPEIQKAAVAGSGWAIRHSDTLRYDLLYSAHRFTSGEGRSVFIRLAVPLKEVRSAIGSMRIRINLVIIFLFLCSAALLIWQTERVRKLVHEVSDFAGSLAHGLFGKRLYLRGAGEFSDLSDDLNTMASEMESAMRTRDEETNRLSVILKSIPDALILVNTDGIIEMSNTAASELFGSADLDGRPFIEVIRNPVFSSLIEGVKKNRSPGSTDMTLDTPEERHLFVRVTPLSYEIGKLAGIVAIFHDLTHLKRLEEMRKDFVANVSHEIRTPVTAIRGFAETLIDGALGDRRNAEKFLHRIKTHSERLNRLVEDLLTLSKIELGAIKIETTGIDIAHIIDDVVQTTSVRAAEKNLAVIMSVDPEEISITADRDRTEQILLNLVDNAIKFTQTGSIEIGVSREHNRRCLFVKDTGMGIPEKYLSRIGERFFRVDPSRSRELGGTGLGLAIVKHLVKAHGWEMEIESQAGRGTTVKVFYA